MGNLQVLSSSTQTVESVITPFYKLTYRFNANTKASTTTQSILFQPACPLPGMIQLQIDKRTIATDYKKALCNTLTLHPIDTYLIHKYNWTPQTIDLIKWNAHGAALYTLPTRTLKTTTQLIH
jgi:hypothetical protein